MKSPHLRQLKKFGPRIGRGPHLEGCIPAMLSPEKEKPNVRREFRREQQREMVPMLHRQWSTTSIAVSETLNSLTLEGARKCPFCFYT